jgi:hypothetical protein
MHDDGCAGDCRFSVSAVLLREERSEHRLWSSRGDSLESGKTCLVERSCAHIEV